MLPSFSFQHQLRRLGYAVLILVIGVILAFIFSSVVPFNMDEFIHYDTLICRLFPASDLSNSACFAFDLNFANTGLTLPLRAYHYSGSFPALYYLPLLSVWQNPASVRFLGLIFIFLEGLILARIFRWKPIIVIPVLALIFPFTFIQLVDTGPVTFHLLSIFLLYVLFDRWSQTLRVRYMAGIVLILFLSVWTKFAYFWMLPGIGIIGLMHCVQHKKFLWKCRLAFLLQSTGGIGALIAMTSALIFSTHPADSNVFPYLDALLHSQAYSMKELFTVGIFESGVMDMLFHPLNAAHRIFLVEPATTLEYAYSITLYLCVPILLAMLFFVLRKNRASLLVPTTLYCSFLLTVLMIVRTSDSNQMHHAILAYPFLLLALAATVKRAMSINTSPIKDQLRLLLLSFGAVFAMANIFFWATFWKLPIESADDWSKMDVNHFLYDPDLSREYNYVVVDWGLFFIQGLFGDPHQSVTYLPGLRTQGDMDFLASITQPNRRRLLLIYNAEMPSSDMSLLQQTFGLVPCTTFENTVWSVLAQPGETFSKACSGILEY